MKILVISDLHLGKGHFLENGRMNIFEDFFHDEEFSEFLNYYSSDKYYNEEVHLILNGDIFNLIDIEHDDKNTTILTEEWVLKSFEMIIHGHALFFDSLRLFLRKPNKKVFYIFGNHDQPVYFENVQNKFREVVEAHINFSFFYEKDCIRVEHGHRFERHNFPPNNKQIIEYQGKKIINLPWGSLFLVTLMPDFKRERPYFDKIRPISVYLKWCLVHDTGFFFKLFWRTFKYILSTYNKKLLKINQNYKTSWKLIKEISLYPFYETNAERIFKERTDLKLIVMGHTHVAQWRRFGDGLIYINSGTWSRVTSIDAGKHLGIEKRSFIFIDYNEVTKTIQNSSICQWNGTWKPYKTEIKIF